MDDPRKRRNFIIAGTVGGFVLPLAGLIGALVFFAQDDRDAGWRLVAGSVAGIVTYAVILTM